MKTTSENFVAKALTVHGDTYDYSRAKYVRSHDKVEIICRKHGVFMQDPMSHLKGAGCAKCNFEAMQARNLQNQAACAEAFIRKARVIHGNTYDYGASNYVSATTNIEILCATHGLFEITPANHLSGRGCPSCGKKKADEAKRKNAPFVPLTDIERKAMLDARAKTLVNKKAGVFVDRARAIHGDAYAYDKSEYQGARSQITITCPEHGDFTQQPANHLHSEFPTGCPKCAAAWGPSKMECELFDYVTSLCPDAEQSVRGKFDDGRELDIFIPSLSIAIEFNGLIWHSSRFGKAIDYHQSKTDDAARKGIRLIHIFQDEWRDKRAWCEAFLRMQLVGPDRRIMGRKCSVTPIDSTVAMGFHDTYHLQGRRGGRSFALMHGDEMLAVATVSTGELVRWTVRFGVVIAGGLSKVLRYINLPLFSYCDTAKHQGVGYRSAGWQLESRGSVAYHYTDGVRRMNRKGYQKKKLQQIQGVTGSTEKELAASLGLYQIGGCRQLKFVWNPVTLPWNFI